MGSLLFLPKLWVVSAVIEDGIDFSQPAGYVYSIDLNWLSRFGEQNLQFAVRSKSLKQ